MKKWKMLAIFEYFVPLIFFVLTKLFTRWGHDIENCIFAFFVGLLKMCIRDRYYPFAPGAQDHEK